MNQGQVEKAKILIVDDNELNRLVLRDLLRSSGHIPISAENGIEALEVLENKSVDLILLDVIMPKMDGFETLKRIRLKHSSSVLPVIMTTALSQSKDIVKALNFGANDYIIKPIDLQVALARIQTQLTLLHSERALRKSEERYALAAQGARDGLWDWDFQLEEVYYSARWKSMLGFKDEEIENLPEEWFNRLHPDDISRVRKAIDDHIQGITSDFASEHRILHKNGEYIWVFCRGIAIKNEHGEAYRMAGSQTDITNRDAHDSLTGLPKRNFFLDQIQFSMDQYSHNPLKNLFAIIHVNVYRFKIINDSYGHLFGDKVLIEVAKRLQSCLSSTDILSRLEGDDFAILLTKIHSPDAPRGLARKILRTFENTMNINGKDIGLTLVMGISQPQAGFSTPVHLLRNAHTALSQAKASGRASFKLFDEGMYSKAMELIEIENDLRKAIKNTEFYLLFQPQINLATGKAIGAEVLLRWSHPKKGIISPHKFIPVAENTGMILPLGLWAFKTACQTWLEFREKGIPPFRIAVNISGYQFKNENFLSEVRKVLKKEAVPPEWIEFEITETILLDNLEHTHRTLSEIHDMGIAISIDDFGTGYSSLSYLKKFPIDTLKIDRSFIREIPEEADDAAITSAIIAMAHNLKRKVIAEGVETKEQLEFLKKLSCEESQGYYFSKPISKSEFFDYLYKDLC
ncbi:MAG: hypothetical protein CSA81_12415 [Acidobacteria bacterium]|nr:MAG: hypothetical protein CSA81_12415 [Acidobacteriota bacterium]